MKEGSQQMLGMTSGRRIRILAIVVGAAFSVASCSSPVDEVARATASKAPSPTATPLPTETAIATPTKTPEPTREPRLGFEIPVTWAQGVTFKIQSVYIGKEYKSPLDGTLHYSGDQMLYFIIKGKSRGSLSLDMVHKLYGFPGARNGKLYLKSGDYLKYKKYKDFGEFWDTPSSDEFIFEIRDSDKGPYTFVNDIYSWSVDLSSLPIERSGSSGNKP